MSYEQFVSFVREYLQKILPEEYRDAGLECREMVKAGARYHGLIVLREGETAGHVIDLDLFYRRYLEGEPEGNVLIEMSRIVRMPPPVEDLEWLRDYEKVKDHLVLRLCSRQKNEEYLEDTVYLPLCDLAVTCHIAIMDGEEDMVSTVVKPSMLEMYAISREQLFHDALDNSMRLFPAEIVRFDPCGFQMLTNKHKVNGASAILYPGLLKKISEDMGGDLFILPSSVHEVILLRTGPYDFRDLEAMVREVNRTQVEPVDQLSDHVYLYHAEKDLLEMAGPEAGKS